MTDWQTGYDDAQSFRPMRSGMSRAYYDGYLFGGAVDGLW